MKTHLKAYAAWKGGFYVACGAEVSLAPLVPSDVTTVVELVTCGLCRNTRAWHAVSGALHAYAAAFWPRLDGVLGMRMCGASNTHGAGTDKMWEVTCAHCLDTILDYMVAARAKLKDPPTARAARSTNCTRCNTPRPAATSAGICDHCFRERLQLLTGTGASE